MIKVMDRGGIEVLLTETTLNELVAAVEKAKTEVDFIHMTRECICDLSKDEWKRQLATQGVIYVESDQSDIRFVVDLENVHTREKGSPKDYKCVI